MGKKTQHGITDTLSLSVSLSLLAGVGGMRRAGGFLGCRGQGHTDEPVTVSGLGSESRGGWSQKKKNQHRG